MKKPRYILKLDDIKELDQQTREKLKAVCKKFVFRANDYYLSLINWKDPNDPIKRIIMPDEHELDEWGRLDASYEENYTIAPGVEHKYDFTAILLVNDICGGYCRFCFRKRLFMNENDEVTRDISEGLKYFKEHKELTNVLLTGGDPLITPTPKLEKIIKQIRDIDHIQIIRIGTKIPAFNPYRIVDDPSLAEMIKKYSTAEKKIYIMVHFSHPNELTEIAIKGLNELQKAGAVLCNQTPLLRGVNDNSTVLTQLFKKLSFIGVEPYYVFQCRPTLGNKTYSVPIEEGFAIFDKALMNCSGLAKRARFVMSHATGKIEIIGKTNGHIYFRYHRAAEEKNKQVFMVFKRNPKAYWFDDYKEIISQYSVDKPYRCFGPE